MIPKSDVKNYRLWLGKPGFLSFEVDKLISLLKEEILTRKSSLMLSSNPDYKQWIGNDSYHSCEEPLNLAGGICLLTSGTTGKAKENWKSLPALMEEKRGAGSIEDVWLLTYHPSRWAGLSVILHAIKHNCKLIVPNDLSPQSILDKINEVTHISLTPSLFRKLLIYDYEKLKSASIKQITFGGEYTTQKVLDDARTLWPNAKITHIYAMTELGDICACSDGLEGLPIRKLKMHWELENGNLSIDGFITGDLWKLENERLYFIGRDVETINIGGAKITQSVVEQHTNAVDGVHECRAYPVSSALLGQIVGLDYVGDITPVELKKALVQKLPKYAVPVKLNKVESIELTSAGKITRK